MPAGSLLTSRHIRVNSHTAHAAPPSGKPQAFRWVAAWLYAVAAWLYAVTAWLYAVTAWLYAVAVGPKKLELETPSPSLHDIIKCFGSM